jgi:hypothetical protein
MATSRDSAASTKQTSHYPLLGMMTPVAHNYFLERAAALIMAGRCSFQALQAGFSASELDLLRHQYASAFNKAVGNSDPRLLLAIVKAHWHRSIAGVYSRVVSRARINVALIKPLILFARIATHWTDFCPPTSLRTRPSDGSAAACTFRARGFAQRFRQAGVPFASSAGGAVVSSAKGHVNVARCAAASASAYQGFGPPVPCASLALALQRRVPSLRGRRPRGRHAQGADVRLRAAPKACAGGGQQACAGFGPGRAPCRDPGS